MLNKNDHKHFNVRIDVLMITSMVTSITIGTMTITELTFLIRYAVQFKHKIAQPKLSSFNNTVYLY